MDKKSKDTIQEVIKDLLNKRFMIAYEKSGKSLDELYKNKEKQKEFYRSIREKGLYEVLNIDNSHTKFYDRQVIKLNNLLEKKDKNIEVLNIEQQMKKIQVKKYISIKEFEEIYGYSKSTQQRFRRRKNPIPYRQISRNGSIAYEVELIEEWFKSQL